MKCSYCKKLTTKSKSITFFGKIICRYCTNKIEELVIGNKAMKETECSAKILKTLREQHSAVCLSIAGSFYQDAGWPDAFIAHEKFVGFIEFKGKNTAVRKLQAHTIKLLKRKEVNVFVVRFVVISPRAYCWRIEDELGQEIKMFSFSEFSKGVAILLDSLHELVETQKAKNKTQ